MGVDLIFPSFSVGELSPDLFGRTDLQAFHRSAATMRNLFVNYKGGASSRAGTAFIGRCKQSGSALPPRDINFQFSLTQSYALEFGEQYMRVKTNGAYVTESGFSISAATKANPIVITVPGHDFVNDDWIYIADAEGMTELNGHTFIVYNVSGNSMSLKSIFEIPVDSIDYSTYTGNGTASRIFTLSTPYVSADLPLLKFGQSADVMTLVHNNYPPYNLTRNAADDWTLAEISFASSIAAPASITTSASSTTTTNPAGYQYVATAVTPGGEESVASPIGSVTDSVNINSVLGSLTTTWAAVSGAETYNIYKAPVAANGVVPVGIIFGYIGTTFGLTFVDSNITQDFSVAPPLHINPFAINSIASTTITAGGSGYTSSPTVTVTSSTGSGAALKAVLVGGVLTAIIIENAGEDYAASDIITVSGGGGTGATATLTLGPSTGTYPGVVAYFQLRRAFANTLNQPDTYFMSKPGQFNNFDASPVAIDSDAIEGTPWAQQVNEILWMIPMPGGLIVLTGLGAWQLNGGGQGQPVTPADQDAQPQAYNGCNPQVQPLNINFDILYVQAKGTAVRDLQYQLLANIYTGTDISVLSSHLFEGIQIEQWAWAEEPYKIVWVILSNGRLLSLTFLKEQEVQGWARHDTNGIFVSVCVVSEPPVDAPYFIVKRQVNGSWWYYSERMNNRLWENIEDCWCVDSAISLTQPTPEATLIASASNGLLEIGSIDVISGGSGYVSPIGLILDPTGSGAEISITAVAGVITTISVDTPGEGYTSPQVVIEDSAGMGAVAHAVISNQIQVSASTAVFSSGDVGKILRAGGGIGEVTDFVSNQILNIELQLPITDIILNDPDDTPLPFAPGEWSLTTPVDELSNLDHLEDKLVTGLADGAVIPLTRVVDGTITLAQEASSIVVGLPFLPQLQSLYTDIPGEETVQGKRKNIQQVIARVKSTRGMEFGSNQINASTVQNQANVPWTGLIKSKDRGALINAGRAVPLFTGDIPINIPGNFGKPGQVAVQQPYPLPMNISALIPEVVVGDDSN